jgi:hypothetical protein
VPFIFETISSAILSETLFNSENDIAT